MNNTISIDGKIILLTGAFGLIGMTLARSFLTQGAKVILADANKRKAALVEKELKLISKKSDYLICIMDVTKPLSIKSGLAASIKKFKTIDVLINNAAIDAKFDKSANKKNNQTRFENFPISLLQTSFDVNVKGLIMVTQAVVTQMLKQGHGNIINVASTYSQVAPNQGLYDFGDDIIRYKPVDYVVTKSMIPNFTKYLATFYAANNIRCNAIAPHAIYNEHSEQFVKNFSRLSPIGRMANKEELTGPFTFLASDASSYMTGSILTVDGGWTAW
jgi:NAD(P)-dependent dehydrogenase (short-subunit alcohol dehydrogenase family)